MEVISILTMVYKPTLTKLGDWHQLSTLGLLGGSHGEQKSQWVRTITPVTNQLWSVGWSSHGLAYFGPNCWIPWFTLFFFSVLKIQRDPGRISTDGRWQIYRLSKNGAHFTHCHCFKDHSLKWLNFPWFPYIKKRHECLYPSTSLHCNNLGFMNIITITVYKKC